MNLGNLTNGVSAELITATDGVSVLGIRVLWAIKPEFSVCQLSSLKVTLNSHSRDITVSSHSAEFFNLDCNTWYTPCVSVISTQITIKDSGAALFYGGTTI